MSEMFQLIKNEKRAAILNESGNLLIMGGPGSGKTTIALFKAKQIVETSVLKSDQKVLFLSFARATVSRVEEHAGTLVPQNVKRSIEINTYHGFIWNILKNHGYLLNTHPIRLWGPHEAATRLAGTPSNQLKEKELEVFYAEGLVHFDLFAQLCSELLTESSSLRRIIADIYPVIILDEFQDTNSDEWELIKTLGRDSQLIALADPDQRIYDFRGADPKRIAHFIAQCNPTVFDFGKENNRSNGTDIVQYGNDLLAGKNKGKSYNDVSLIKYSFCKKPLTHIFLKRWVLMMKGRLEKRSSGDWSIAVLVPTNALMLEVSDAFQKEQTLCNGTIPIIPHEAAIETSGPALAALFLATLLEESCDLKKLVKALSNHIEGRRGNKVASQSDIALAAALKKFTETGKIAGKNRTLIVHECKALTIEAKQTPLHGNIIEDWKALSDLISKKEAPCIKQIATDLRYLRLLQRGSQLYSSLDGLWRNAHSYSGAVGAVDEALIQEHFSMATKTWNGINVMTIHKAKGKEFDVVIIYEGRFQNRIVSRQDRIDQARLNLRVAVTRARLKTIIMTPDVDPCPLV